MSFMCVCIFLSFLTYILRKKKKHHVFEWFTSNGIEPPSLRYHEVNDPPALLPKPAVMGWRQSHTVAQGASHTLVRAGATWHSDYSLLFQSDRIDFNWKRKKCFHQTLTQHSAVTQKPPFQTLNLEPGPWVGRGREAAGSISSLEVVFPASSPIWEAVSAQGSHNSSPKWAGLNSWHCVKFISRFF